MAVQGARYIHGRLVTRRPRQRGRLMGDIGLSDEAPRSAARANFGTGCKAVRHGVLRRAARARLCEFRKLTASLGLFVALSPVPAQANTVSDWGFVTWLSTGWTVDSIAVITTAPLAN